MFLSDDGRSSDLSGKWRQDGYIGNHQQTTQTVSHNSSVGSEMRMRELDFRGLRSGREDSCDPLFTSI